MMPPQTKRHTTYTLRLMGHLLRILAQDSKFDVCVFVCADTIVVCAQSSSYLTNVICLHRFEELK